MDATRSLRLRLLASLLVWIVAAAGATSAAAQGQNATLTGTVTDNAGIIPGATVVATDPATGLTRSAESNEQGVFRVLSLPAGRYAVRIEMAGFRQINLNDIQLVSGETRDLGRLVLEVGTLAEAVTVSAEVTPVNTTTGSLQRNMTGDQLTMIQVQGTRHLRHDENPAGRQRYDIQPRLCRLAVGPRTEHQRGHVTQQEHDD